MLNDDKQITRATTSKRALPADEQVGLRLKAARQLRGMSQEKLGDAIGVTFQQVQKYERGSNRISAGKLVMAAKALEQHVTYFLPEADGAALAGGDIPPQMVAMCADKAGSDIVQAFPGLPKKLRTALRNFIVELAEANNAA